MDTVQFVKSCSPILLTIAVGLSTPVFADSLNLDSDSLYVAQNTTEAAQQISDTSKPVSALGDAVAVEPSAGGLSETLVNKLGISSAQAEGGAGAIFKAAQSQLDAGQFAKLSAAVPEMDSLLSAAPKQSSSTANLINGASSMLGDSASRYGNLAGLASSFKDLNLSPDMVDQFVPVVVDYVKKNGGDMTGDILQSALYGN